LSNVAVTAQETTGGIADVDRVSSLVDVLPNNNEGVRSVNIELFVDVSIFDITSPGVMCTRPCPLDLFNPACCVLVHVHWIFLNSLIIVIFRTGNTAT